MKSYRRPGTSDTDSWLRTCDTGDDTSANCDTKLRSIHALVIRSPRLGCVPTHMGGYMFFKLLLLLLLEKADSSTCSNWRMNSLALGGAEL
jgi:hypothetical protein